MREILFRGKRMDGTGWAYGVPVKGLYNEAVVGMLLVRIVGYDPRYKFIPDIEGDGVNPATVGQFTGLYDRNGNRVFEGDVLEILFKRSGLSRHFAESRESWQGITKSLEFCVEGKERKTYCLQGNGIDRADTAGCNGRGWCEDVSYTLNTIDRPAVCSVFDARGNGDGNIVPTITGDHENRVTDYTAICVALDRAAYNQGQNAQYDMGVDESGKAFTVIAKGPGAACYAMQRSDEYKESDIASTQGARQFKSATDIVCYAVDIRNNRLQDINGTLQAKPSGGTSLNLNNVVLIPAKIILRRLTPTECARLQGMPDWWVDGIECPNPTDDDMRFWREVFNTFASVTGCKPKTDNQIRKWLTNPHSDSAEYKMWGNSMALPCVLYVMEGVKEILKEEENE